MLDAEQSVATLILDHPECAIVFRKHGIDFCCRGQESVRQASAEKGINVGPLLEELTAAVSKFDGQPISQASTLIKDPRTLSTPALIAVIISNHHEYLRSSLPFVSELAAKVGRVHGEHNPKLVQLDSVVQKLVAALGPHLEREEGVLFPALMSKTGDQSIIAQELGDMHREHLEVGGLLDEIIAASDSFTVPEWACNSYRALFHELNTLDGDIRRHVHLENHVLMPRFAANA